MATDDDSGADTPRKRISSFLPENFDVGRIEAELRVTIDHELGAIVLVVFDHDIELMLAPQAAIDLVMRIVGGLIQLQEGKM